MSMVGSVLAGNNYCNNTYNTFASVFLQEVRHFAKKSFSLHHIASSPPLGEGTVFSTVFYIMRSCLLIIPNWDITLVKNVLDLESGLHGASPVPMPYFI